VGEIAAADRVDGVQLAARRRSPDARSGASPRARRSALMRQRTADRTGAGEVVAAARALAQAWALAASAAAMVSADASASSAQRIL
jgi:hypothetical protein